MANPFNAQIFTPSAGGRLWTGGDIRNTPYGGTDTREAMEWASRQSPGVAAQSLFNLQEGRNIERVRQAELKSGTFDPKRYEGELAKKEYVGGLLRGAVDQAAERERRARELEDLQYENKKSMLQQSREMMRGGAGGGVGGNFGIRGVR